MKTVLVVKALIRKITPYAIKTMCLALGLGGLGLILLFVYVIQPIDKQSYLKVNSSTSLLDQQGLILYDYLNDEDYWCFEKNLNEISPYLIKATLAVEDQRFYTHFGVDPLAVARAFKQNFTQGRVVSGASTLSMQVVKFAQPHSRSLITKLKQALFALRLDWHIPKDDILHAYLNKASYGMNLIGCEAAARRYFGKPANELTLSEAALLAGLPKAPGLYMPLENPGKALKRRQHVLDRMFEEALISKTDYQKARSDSLGVAWHDFNKHAPHLATRLQPLIQELAHTTLDLEIQNIVETITQKTISRYGDKITNAAAIVVDTQTYNVLAHVGSIDFWNSEIEGQVDCTRATRSPGSALKPFVYALAMKEQCLYPTEKLLDKAWNQGLYNPENFDQAYKGLITASEALRTSRNVPAVTILDRVGIDQFHHYLNQFQFTTITEEPDHYGLGMVLGNCEVTLEELVTAYTAIANLGKYRKLNYSYLNPSSDDVKLELFSRGIGLELYAMLEQPWQGNIENRSIEQIKSIPRVCWKTGTSQGYRDAWAIMFNAHYVVGVWLGNNDGRSSNKLIGLTAAVPLAADLLEALPKKSVSQWPTQKDDLKPVTICALSGLPASTYCQHTMQTYFPKKQYLHRVCDVHYPISNSSSQSVVQTRWPASSKTWDLANIPTNTNQIVSQTQSNTESLSIHTPSNGATYVLTGEEKGDQITLKTSRDNQETIYWYYNGQYYGKTNKHEDLLLKITPGKHQLSCMSERGEIDVVNFKVETPEDHTR